MSTVVPSLADTVRWRLGLKADEAVDVKLDTVVRKSRLGRATRELEIVLYARNDEWHFASVNELWQWLYWPLEDSSD